MEVGDYNDVNRLACGRYTPEDRGVIFDEVLDLLMNGEDALNTILKANPRYPKPTHFFRWVRANEETEAAYRLALEVRSHMLYHKLMAIADGNKNEPDSLTAVSRDRLRCDSLKFFIAKALPKVYGEKIDITSDGRQINVINLGQGVAPPPVDYIDITPPPPPLIEK